MSDLFTVQPVAYMDDGTNQTFPATEADVRKWVSERGLALVPAEPTRQMISAAEDAYMPFGDMALALQVAIAEAQGA